MSKDYKNISLEKLKDDICSIDDIELGSYFDDELLMKSHHGENGYSIIVDFFNHLKDDYNKCISENSDGAKSYHGTLLRVFSWFLPFLNPYHQIILQSNLCILADDEQDSEVYKKYFQDNLKQANSLIEIMREQILVAGESEKEALIQALDSIGYLNIREHNYEHAIICIRMNIDLLLKSNIGNPAHPELFDLYIKSIVRLANCYEYTDRPWYAIEYMLSMDNTTSIGDKDLQEKWENLIKNNAEKIRETIIGYYNLPYDQINRKDRTINIVKTICSLLFINTVDSQQFNVFMLSKNKQPISETLKSYIHVLAHCISEYAAKIREVKYSHPFISTLQMVSRFLLDWLVVSCCDKSLITCQATVRAENDACPEAIKLLLKRYAELESKRENCTVEEQNELHEIEFFLFYFSEQELRYNYTDESLIDIFKQYGDKFFESASDKAKIGDFDALFHYYVIEFKYLFKQKVDKFIHTHYSSELNAQQVDNIFLEMCKCKKQCSEQIFKGLIDECERLEQLYTMFRQLQYLNKRNVSQTKVNLFNQLCKIYQKTETDINIKEAVVNIHKEIIKRNKILILAPIKNAPSCSSEYNNIQNLLELPVNSIYSSSIDGAEFIKGFKKIEREHQQTFQYDLNPSAEYSNLKWAIFYPNRGAFVYLYIKSESTKIKYHEVIPLYLDKEQQAIIDILKKIDDDLIDEFEFSISEKMSLCNSECSYCNTYILNPNDKCNLKKIIDELLTFLEFDFYANSQIGHFENEYIIIDYPKDEVSAPHDFWVLAYDEYFPKKENKKNFCDICKNCFVNLNKKQFANEDIQLSEKPLLELCKIFSKDQLEEKRKELFNEIDNLALNSEEKKLIKKGESIPKSTDLIIDYANLCKRLDLCLNGKCDNIQKKICCETYKLLKEHSFV